MRVLYGIIVFFALFLLACSDAEREEKRLEGNLLMKGDSGVCYDGIGLTESYLVLLARGCDTIIQVFDKDDLSHLHAFALKGYGATYFSNPEFMKSNTKEPAGKDEFWIVDNQLTFNKMQVLADSLRFDRKYICLLYTSNHELGRTEIRMFPEFFFRTDLKLMVLYIKLIFLEDILVCLYFQTFRSVGLRVIHDHASSL